LYSKQRGVDVQRYDWEVSYQASDGTVIGPKFLASFDISTFEIKGDLDLPTRDIQFDLDNIAEVLGISLSDISEDDIFRFEAKLQMQNGDVFGLENTGTNIISSSPFNGLFGFESRVGCFQNLEGIFEYSTLTMCENIATGTIEWVLTDDGNYRLTNSSLTGNIGDYLYGAFHSCFGASERIFNPEYRIVQECNLIYPLDNTPSFGGEVFVFYSVETFGNELVIEWEETSYGIEYGTTTLTRTDGQDWPDLTNE
jgi:hypothetical protein